MLLVLALGVGGVGLMASYLREPALPANLSRPALLPASQPAPKPTTSKRTDLSGDPLPDGAISRLGAIRLNHGARVGGVAFTPDGKSLLSFGGNGIARVWDPSTGK
jgi:hypothetical protein